MAYKNLIADKLIELTPETLEKIREFHHLDDPHRRKEAVENLREWIKKQEHFVKTDYSDRYLEWSILTRKGSVERAKETIDKICTLRTLYPHFFGVYNVKEDLGNIKDNIMCFALPKLINTDVRVYLVKFFDRAPISSYFMDYLRYVLVMTEYISAYDFIEKIILVVDFRDVNLMSFVTDVNFIELRNNMTVLLEGYGVRPQNIFLISDSKVMVTLIGILKTFLKPKIIQRIRVIKSHEELYDSVPREMLPKDYGGKAPTLKEHQERWTEALSSEDCMDVQRKMAEYRTDESRRTTGQFSEQYAGVAGTFRYLKVD